MKEMEKVTKSKRFNYQHGITHSGIFHADDVFSSALCQILNPLINIKRVFKIEEDMVDEDTIIFDIGLGFYDHHQSDNEIRPDGTPYAAFGKLWRAFGMDLCLSQEAWTEVEETLVKPIDFTDNTGIRNPLSLAIHKMNPSWDSKMNSDEAFFSAVVVAKSFLEAAIDSANAKARAKNCLKEHAVRQGEILVLDRFLPWQEEVIRNMPEIDFVIFPSNRGGYNIQTVPTELGSRENRVSFPENWLGNPVHSLGMTFCHPGNWLASAETLEQAISIAQIAVQSA